MAIEQTAVFDVLVFDGGRGVCSISAKTNGIMDMKKKRILIAEDEIITSMEIRDKLTGLGYDVIGEATSGERAIALVDEKQPDLILIDIRLKGDMDGIEVAENIRSKFDLPVVYLTAYSDERTLERARVTEPYSYLLKPFADKELHTAIELALYHHTMEKNLKESRQWFAMTLRSIGEGVIATRTDGSIKFMNPAAEKLTGWDEKKALGMPLADVFRVESASEEPSIENPGSAVLEAGKGIVTANHALLVKKDGSKIPIEDSTAPIKDDQGHILGVVVVFRIGSGRAPVKQEKS